VFLDQIIYKHYTGIKEVLILIFYDFIEPIAFHPINIYASIKGVLAFFKTKEQNGGTQVYDKVLITPILKNEK
jgi:hypothetical protein